MNKVNIIDFREAQQDRAKQLEFETSVNDLLEMTNKWKHQNRNARLAGFAGIAYFADFIRQIAPSKEDARKFIEDALDFQLFSEDD